MRFAIGPAERESGLWHDRILDVTRAVRPNLHGDPAACLVFDQYRRILRAVVERIFLEGVRFAPYHARPPRGHLVSAEYLHVTRLARNVLVNARGDRLLHLDMAVLARGRAFDMSHSAGACLMAVHTLDLLAHVHVFGKAGRLGEFPAEIAVASSSFHGARVADKGAPPSAGAVR